MSETETRRIILVSPNEELIRNLSRGFREAGIGDDTTVVSEYPRCVELRQLLDWSPAPVASVVVDLSDKQRALELIRAVSHSHSTVAAVAARSSRSIGSVIAAARAGASQYISSPWNGEELRRCVGKLRSTDDFGPRHGRLVSFIPAQGGSGASTIALHAAHSAASQMVDKSLLVDFDFHSGTLSFRLRLQPEFTLGDSIIHPDLFDELWDKSGTNWRGVDLLPAPNNDKPIDLRSLSRISELLRWAKASYGCVVVDMPPALYTSCWDVVRLSNAVYVVCTPGVQSVYLARARAQELLKMDLPHTALHLVVNGTKPGQELKASSIARFVGLPVAAHLRHDQNSAENAWLEGGLIAPDSELGQQLHLLSRHVCGAEDETPQAIGDQVEFVSAADQRVRT